MVRCGGDGAGLWGGSFAIDLFNPGLHSYSTTLTLPVPACRLQWTGPAALCSKTLTTKS